MCEERLYWCNVERLLTPFFKGCAILGPVLRRHGQAKKILNQRKLVGPFGRRKETCICRYCK